MGGLMDTALLLRCTSSLGAYLSRCAVSHPTHPSFLTLFLTSSHAHTHPHFSNAPSPLSHPPTHSPCALHSSLTPPLAPFHAQESLAGYALRELVHLSRSAVSSQRSMAWHILARVLEQIRNGVQGWMMLVEFLED